MLEAARGLIAPAAGLISIFVLMPRDVQQRRSRSLRGRDPMFEHIERHMDDIVERLMRRPSSAAYRRAWAPRVDVYETDSEFVAVAELAGVAPSAVTIEIDGEVVLITGQRPPAVPPKGAELLQLEIPFGAFERRLALPCGVDAKNASADFSDGVLTVRLPKLQRGPQRVQVDTQRDS
jgi:HSP20 family protein